MAAEQRDALLADRGPSFGGVDAEALLWSETEDADLPLVLVAVDGAGRLAHLGEWVHGGEEGLDAAHRDQAVGVPRLLVVGEVAGDETLQLHPEVAVVELDHVAAGRRAGDDR